MGIIELNTRFIECRISKGEWHRYLKWQGLQHRHVGLIVRYYLVSRLISASHVKTSALVRDQLQVWLHHDSVEVLDTAVVL